MENLSAKDQAPLAGNGVALGNSCNAVFRAQIYSQNREAESVHTAGDNLLRLLCFIFKCLEFLLAFNCGF